MDKKRANSGLIPSIQEINVDRNPFDQGANLKYDLIQPDIPAAQGLNSEDVALMEADRQKNMKNKNSSSHPDYAKEEDEDDPDTYCIIFNKRDSGVITALKGIAAIVFSPILLVIIIVRVSWELLKMTGQGLTKAKN